MNRRTPLLVAAGVTALAMTGLLGSAGAAAAELGPLYVVGYEDQILVAGAPTAPADLTEIASAIPGLARFSVSGGDVAAGSSTAYLIGAVGAERDGCSLFALDLVTGAASAPVDIAIAGTADPVQSISFCYAFDIADDGTAWLSGNEPETDDPMLYTVDLSTGAATQIGFLWDTDDDGPVGFNALASSADGTLYGVTDRSEIYLVDPETAVVPTDNVEATQLADMGIVKSGWNWNADFDANGTLWVNTYTAIGGPTTGDLLWSFDVTTPATPAVSSGTIQQGTRLIDTGAMFFGPTVTEPEPTPAEEPALAETGVDPFVGLLAGGVLILTGILATVVVRRRGWTSSP